MRISAAPPLPSLPILRAPTPPPPPPVEPDLGPQANLNIEDLDLIALKYMLDLLRGESAPLMDAAALELTPDTQRALSALASAVSDAPAPGRTLALV